MCLIKDKRFHPHNRPLIADRDIICYKKLLQIGDAYFTPVTETPVSIECIQNKVPFQAIILHKFIFMWEHILGFSNHVENGFIHSLQEDDGYRPLAVFECIIPKGTKYFVGIQGDYASERIIFLEKIV